MLFFGIVMISLGSILPEVTAKFQLSKANAGYLLTLLPSGILVGSLIFGPMVDWLSYKTTLITGSIFTMIGLEGLAFSEILTLLHVSVFCIGLGGGFLNGVTNALVSEISEADHSANLSILGVFFGIGALGTPVVLGLAMGIYSFEVILGLLGAFIMLPIIYFIFLRFPKSAKTVGLPLEEGLKMIKEPLLLLFGAILFFQSGIEGLTNNWTTTYLEAVKEVDGPDALFVLSSFVGALTVARIILGKILRIYNPLTVMLLGLTLAFLGCSCILFGESFHILVFGMMAMGVGLAAGFPVILGYIGQTYTYLSGTAFSIVITIALIGNILANYAMGTIAERFGLGVLPSFIIIAVVAIMILLFITRRNFSAVINQN